MESISSALVTGANRGIGLEFVRQLLASATPPRHVIAACRNPDAAQDLKTLASSNNTLKLIKLDLNDIKSFESAAKEVSHIVGNSGLQLLINNAGIYHTQSFEDVTEEAVMESLKVNAVAPLMLTKSLRYLLKTAGRLGSPSFVVNVTSGYESIGYLDTNPIYYPYNTSKAALNMIAKSMSLSLKDDGILVYLFCPGWVQTDMGGANASLRPSESVSGMLKIVLAMRPEDSGKFLNYAGQKYEW